MVDLYVYIILWRKNTFRLVKGTLLPNQQELRPRNIPFITTRQKSYLPKNEYVANTYFFQCIFMSGQQDTITKLFRRGIELRQMLFYVYVAQIISNQLLMWCMEVYICFTSSSKTKMSRLLKQVYIFAKAMETISYCVAISVCNSEFCRCYQEFRQYVIPTYIIHLPFSHTF